MKRILFLLAATLLGWAAVAAPAFAYIHTTLPLDGAWQMRQARGHQTYPAIVPGTVHTDLMAAGVIDDPFMGFGERAVQWVDKEDWIYTRTFDVPDSLLAHMRAELCFDGLDTYADVTLNGTRILQADNMFRRWRVAVDSLLKPTGNVLEVYLHSPVKVDLPKWEAYPVHYRVSNDQSANGGLLDRQISVFARKAGYHYGWDWGPRIVTSGIWRSVRLEFSQGAVLRDVFFHQVAVSAKEARLRVEVEVETRVSGPATVAIGAEGIRPVYSRQQLEPGLNRIEVPVTIRKPQLWWPAGQGKAYLYDFHVAVQQGNLSCGSYRTKVGLRSVRLVRNADAKGRSFYFEVNGRPVFMKGANYIPNDLFLPRVGREGYERVVGDAAAAGMNMLRVWGGGVYEDDYFYELCDRYGILVWQDFMFSCSIYPYEGALRESVLAEAEDNVRRLRNHPCIALWCGNNECCDMWYGWSNVQKGIPAYDNMAVAQLNLQYYHDLPEVVRRCSPGTDYVPSSPWSPEGSRNTNPMLADSHYWTPWQKRGPSDQYERHHSRFYSEYGFQSFAGMETVRVFAPDSADWRPDSEMMMFHQRGGSRANRRMLEMLEDEYYVPERFSDLVYLTQMAQGDIMRRAVESHRRDRDLCGGTLVWQLNDCWPVASWSGRDWYGTWKPLHYFLRDAYRDVLPSVSLLDGEMSFWVVSDRPSALKGTLEVSVERFDGSPLWRERMPVSQAAGSAVCWLRMEQARVLGPVPASQAYVRTVFTDASGVRYRSIRLLSSVKEAQLPRPKFSVSVVPAGDGLDVTVSTDVFAKGVFLHIPGAMLRLDASGKPLPGTCTALNFSDNYFDLTAGESRTVHVSSPLPPDEFRSRLVVTSI